MELLNNFFLPPSSDHLHLVKYLILIVYFIHIPFISLLLGGTLFSVFFRLLSINNLRSHYRQVSRDFIEVLIFRKTAGIILGVLPLIVLTLIEGQVFYDANIAVVKFLMYATLLISVGITLTYFYQYSFQMAEENIWLQLLSGLAALFFLLLGYFIFSVNSALIFDPGRWANITGPSRFLFSWNVIARYLHFLCATLAVSGLAIVFFSFNWKESRRELEPKYAGYLQKLGGGIGLAFTLLQPVLIFWNLITLPDPALTAEVFVYTLLVLFLILLISLRLYRMVKTQRIQLGTGAFILFVLVLVIMIVNDHTAREAAIQNHTQMLMTRSNEIESEREARHEAERAASIQPDLTVGEQVYKAQCTSCHRFDQKIVGPPYNSVLGKYQNNPDALIQFIRNPNKVNPDYPAMPKLGLSEMEIKSVVAYLLQEWEKQPK
jgi:cytochrome c